MGAQERILVVDDDEGARKTLDLIFSKKGYEVETARTGQEAADKAREQPFNVALLDIKLPDTEGVELVAPLKAAHPDLTVISGGDLSGTLPADSTNGLQVRSRFSWANVARLYPIGMGDKNNVQIGRLSDSVVVGGVGGVGWCRAGSWPIPGSSRRLVGH